MGSPAEREGGRSGQVHQDGKKVPTAPGKWFQESPGRRRKCKHLGDVNGQAERVRIRVSGARESAGGGGLRGGGR